MTTSQRGSIVGSVLGIVFCGSLGGVAAWAIVRAIGLDGVPGAIAAAVIGMVVATGAWIAGASFLCALRRTR